MVHYGQGVVGVWGSNGPFKAVRVDAIVSTEDTFPRIYWHLQNCKNYILNLPLPDSSWGGTECLRLIQHFLSRFRHFFIEFSEISRISKRLDFNDAKSATVKVWTNITSKLQETSGGRYSYIKGLVPGGTFDWLTRTKSEIQCIFQSNYPKVSSSA